MFSEGVQYNELMTFEDFWKQSNYVTAEAATRGFTLYMRKVYGDPTQDSHIWDLTTTYYKVLVDGHYRPIDEYETFYGLWNYYELRDRVSLHKVTALRYNKKYNVYNVQLEGRPGRDMWFAVPKQLIHDYGIPIVDKTSIFKGTYYRLKDNKIIKDY